MEGVELPPDYFQSKIGRKQNKRRAEDDDTHAADWNACKRVRLESYRREMAWEIN
jgi:hypothetical protein